MNWPALLIAWLVGGVLATWVFGGMVRVASESERERFQIHWCACVKCMAARAAQKKQEPG